MRWVMITALLAGCGGPVSKDWSPEQRAAVRDFMIRSVAISAQGGLAGWDNEEWRTAGHIGVGALTDLALRLNAPETATDIAAADDETLKALVDGSLEKPEN